MKKVKHRRFPFIILIIIFLIEAIVVNACLVVYFIHSGKIITADIERYTKNYSMTLVETLSEAVSETYMEKKTSSLQDLFYNRINKDIIDEAFFVLSNGKIIFHSLKTHSENLGGNIGNDEFTYNMEMILYPVLQNTKEVLFADYNVIGTKNPFDFDPRVKKFLKQHIYSTIDSTGWLISKAVFYKNKPVGAVSFIISKQKVFDAIIERFEEVKKYWIFGMAGSAVFSFVIALIFALSIRRRYIEPVIATEIHRSDAEEYIAEDITDDNFVIISQEMKAMDEGTVRDEIVEEFTDDFITIDISDKAKDADTVELGKHDIRELESGEIQDAIPIQRKTLW